MRLRQPIFRTLILVAMATVALSVRAAEPTEAEVKAAFVFNFAKYVDWPDDAPGAASNRFDLCLLGGRNALFEALAELNGKLVKSRDLKVRAVSLADDLKSCQILVLAESEGEHFESVLRRLSGAPVLTVNGSGRFLDAGGIIGLVTDADKVRFDVNLVAAKRANLVLSSNLLRLARQVRRP